MLKHLGTYLAHYAAIVAGGAAFVAAHGSMFAAIPGATPYVAGAVGVSAAVVAALHAIGVDPPKSTAPGLAILAMLSAGILAGGTLTGCASVSSFMGSPNGQAVVAASVDVAIATAEANGITAAQINGIAKQALLADQGASASLNAIAAVVNAQLEKLKLPPADLAAAQVLEMALGEAITAKLQANPTMAQVQSTAAMVIKDVIEATGG